MHEKQKSQRARRAVDECDPTSETHAKQGVPRAKRAVDGEGCKGAPSLLGTPALTLRGMNAAMRFNNVAVCPKQRRQRTEYSCEIQQRCSVRSNVGVMGA